MDIGNSEHFFFRNNFCKGKKYFPHKMIPIYIFHFHLTSLFLWFYFFYTEWSCFYCSLCPQFLHCSFVFWKLSLRSNFKYQTFSLSFHLIWAVGTLCLFVRFCVPFFCTVCSQINFLYFLFTSGIFSNLLIQVLQRTLNFKNTYFDYDLMHKIHIYKILQA